MLSSSKICYSCVYFQDISTASTIIVCKLAFFNSLTPKLFAQLSSRDFTSVSRGTSEYMLAKEDVGQRIAFIYVPINFEGIPSVITSVL